jgi:hypothetical protein
MSEKKEPEVIDALTRLKQAGRDSPMIERLFSRLAAEWREDTEFASSLTDMVLHPAYQRIIGLGPSALPLIFRELERKPDHWFWALKAISGEDPTPPGAHGNVRLMTRAWLDWATDNGFATQ